MKNSRIVSFLAVTLAASLAGCTQDDSLIDGPVPLPSGPVSIPFTVDGMTVGTRATATETRERAVESVDILFFDASSGSYIARTSSSVTPGFMSFSLDIPNSLAATTPYKTLIVGNAATYIPEGFQNFGAYIDNFASKTYDNMKRDLHARAAALPGPTELLPMWGDLVDASGALRDFQFRELSDGSKKFTGYVDFSRSICRVDLRNLAADKLIVSRVRLCNYRTSGHIFHDEQPHGDITKDIEGTAWTGVNSPLPGATVQELKACLYTFPNISPLISQNDETTTCMLIEGYYQDGTDNTPANPTRKLTYYRLNLGENGASQLLRRNFLYRATVKSVSGAGAADAAGAYAATTSPISSQVSGGGSSDESEDKILSDGNGYFLSISSSTLSFEGRKDQSDLITVGVKSGDSWNFSWISGSQFFNCQKVDDETLKISTKLDNTSWSANSGSLKISSVANPALSYTISLMQFSAATEQAQTLTVGGSTGTYELELSGDASSADLLVGTGVADGLWKCTGEGFSGTFTAQGGNNSYLSVCVPANLTDSSLTQTLTVKRVNPDGTDMTEPDVPAVTVTVTQAVCQNRISISPTFSNNMLEIVGFVDQFSKFNCIAGTVPAPNGLAACRQIIVTLADPVNCTWNVESDFNPGIDLFLSTGTDMQKYNLQANHTPNQTAYKNAFTGLKHGECVWLNVFRTAPGDPTITGNIRFSVLKGSTVLQTLVLPVSITTPCIIDDVVVREGSKLLIADRNLGTPRRWTENFNTLIPALNFTNDKNVKIFGYGQSDFLGNSHLKGNYYTWAQATSTDVTATTTCLQFAKDNVNEDSKYYKDADKSKWRLPSNTEFTSHFVKRMQFSKGRAFIVSEEMSDGSTTKTDANRLVGCFFPLSGYSGAPAGVHGYYWSSVTYDSRNAYCLSVVPSSSAVSFNGKTYGLSVRCVRPV